MFQIASLKVELINLVSSEGFNQFMPNGKLVSSTIEIKIAYKSNLPSDYLPFLQEKHANGITDYYAFDTTIQMQELEVIIFSDHAVVKSWKNFDAFIEWLYKNCQSAIA